jgi:hypothetical protein
LEKGADPSLKHNGPAVGMKVKGLTALEMIIPRRRPELKHMHKLLIDLVKRKDFNQQDQRDKQAVIEATSNGDDDLLKGWIVSINSLSLQRSDRCLVTEIHRQRKKMKIALFNSAGDWSRTLQDADLVMSKITLLRKATAEELRRCNAVHCEALLDRQSRAGDSAGRLQVWANEPQEDPNEAGKWRYVFQVKIGTDTVHEISDRFSDLDKKYSKLPELLGVADVVKFPPRDFAKSLFLKAMLEFDSTESAEAQRQVRTACLPACLAPYSSCCGDIGS